jgi:hypothetical protein
MIDIHSANHDDRSSTRPPPKKRLSTKTNASARASPVRAPPVCTGPARSGQQINSDVHASCWSTTKMNCSKQAFFRARSIATNKSTSSAKQSHDMMPRGALFGASPQPRKDKKKKTTIKMDFSFVGERAPFLQSQRKMMARDVVARAPQCLIARAVGTRHNNQKESCVWIYHGKRKRQQ